MTDRSKVISKFYRLKLADELRSFLEAIPVRELHESQAGDNIYMANGELRVGSTYYPAGIRIWLQGIRVVAQVEAPKARVSVFSDPFDAVATAELVKIAARTAAQKLAS
jgi:hypothetical protein